MSAAQPDFSDPLVDALRHLPGEIFAVLDGAHVDGASAQLKARKLAGRPLYLEGGAKGSIETGPHLVTVPGLYALEQLREVTAGKPALVFWAWQHGADALYRHLRTINLVEIPDEERGSGFETVVFRHASPNVMASVLPLLDPAQTARLLGAAAGLAMDAPDFGGVKLMPRPDGLPAMPRGYLRFEKGQYEALGDAQLHKSRLKVVQYLRNSAPQETAGLGQAELYSRVVSFEHSGSSIGLKSERAQAKWAFLMLMTNGEIGKGDTIRTAFATGAGNPDRKLDALMSGMIEQARRA